MAKKKQLPEEVAHSEAYEDEFLCDEIVEQLYRHEAILDVVTDENTFDMNFGYLYCPYAEEHEELTM